MNRSIFLYLHSKYYFSFLFLSKRSVTPNTAVVERMIEVAAIEPPQPPFLAAALMVTS